MKATELQRGALKRYRERWPQLLLAGYVGVWGITAIKPVNRQDWWLENLLVFAVVGALVGTFRRFRFSNCAYGLIAIFMTLHAVGAHYTYSEMPVGNWLRDDWQFSRNHYDRVVHFLFGLLISYPLGELLGRAGGLRRGWVRIATVQAVLAWSALYELLEAVVAQVVSPELGAAYNGIQGDSWDAQKDAALALVGAVISTTLGPGWLGFVAGIAPPSPPPRLASPVAERRRWDGGMVATVYVASLTLVCGLWPQPWTLLLGLLGVSAWMLQRWSQRSDRLFYFAGFVLGPLVELLAVSSGAWTYAKPLWVVPIWLPVLWGIASLFLKRLCATLLSGRGAGSDLN
jgi:putative membrane protein